MQRITEASGSQFDHFGIEVFTKIPIEEWKGIRRRVAGSSSEYLKQLMFELSKYRICAYTVMLY